jgi:hypothetical protein
VLINFSDLANFTQPAASAVGVGGDAMADGADAGNTFTVYDIWADKSLGSFTDSFAATNVPLHGTAFLKLTPASTR